MIEDTPSADAGDTPDSRLVSRVLSGDRDAYALLIERHAPALRRFLGGRGLRGLELDEAAQDAFVRVYQNLGRLRGRDRFAGYLMTTAARQLADRVRRRPAPVAAADPGRLAEEGSPGPPAPPSDDLEAAIAHLPEPMQIVLGLKYGGGKSAAEIARILGQSVNTVTKTLSRAYERLRHDPRLRRAWEEGDLR